MRDIRVVHDRVGCYSDWFEEPVHKLVQEPWLIKYHHDYFEGKLQPNYPMPAIRYEVVINSTLVAIFNEANRYSPVYLAY